MHSQHYVINGRQRGNAAMHFVDGDIKPALRGDNTPEGGEPLDVIFAGKLMTELSNRVGGPATNLERELIKNCLKVESLPPGQFSEAEAQEIWDDTTVEIQFEDRTKPANGGGDKNNRIFVVPASGSLQAGLKNLPQPGVNQPYDPPLTYPIDKTLMLAYQKGDIIDFTVNMPAPDDHSDMSWDEIKSHVAEQTVAWIDKKADASAIGMEDAYYRAVGLYITTMCH